MKLEYITPSHATVHLTSQLPQFDHYDTGEMGMALTPDDRARAGLGVYRPGKAHRYRYGGDYSETIFGPLEQLDRQIRPGHWPQAVEILEEHWDQPDFSSP